MAVSLASKIEFKKLCDVLEEISRAPGPRKEGILKNFIDDCRKTCAALESENEQADVSFFPILRLFLPKLERERGALNLREKTLGDLFIRVFCLGKGSEEARKLQEYKTPIPGKTSVSCDFAERVYWIFRSRLTHVHSSLTVEQINSFLDDVSKKKGESEGRNVFQILFQQISAVELKWITRIILKDLRLGIGKKKIIEAYHPDAMELLDVNSDLRYVCDELKDPKVRKSIQGIEIFCHFKPMLLEECKIEDAEKLFRDCHMYYVQTKCDGERSQLHMKNGVFKYFTRQGYDITHNEGYGEVKSSGGFLTSKISGLLDEKCHSVILDGELMGWHKDKKIFGSKGMSYDVKKLSSTSYHQPCFVAFDIIMYNNDVIIDKPYSERWKLLNDICKEEEGVFMKCHTTEVSNSEQLLRIFNQSIDNDEEGIVLKRPDSTYKPNVREGSGCYKVKPEYSDNLVHDIDLVVLGGYYGEGKYQGLIKSFLMGVIEPPANPDDMPNKFLSIVSVSNGIGMEKLRELNTTFNEYWLKNAPDGVIGPLKGDQPDLWIHPKNSVIFQLRATEIIRTVIYPFGYSLRFPRVVQIRTDKPWYSACTTTQFKSFIKTPGMIQKLTKRRATRNDFDTIAYSKSLKPSKTYFDKINEKVVGVRIYDHRPQPISRLLDGKEICVINGDDELSKEKMEHILLQHRAKVVQNPKKETFCVIAGNIMKQKARNVINSNNYDVVTLDWFKRITDEKNWSALQDFLPWDLVSMRPSTRRRLSLIYDECYDNYTTDADEESLNRSLEKAEEVIEDAEFSPDCLEEMDRELFDSGPSPFSLFRNIVGYFPDPLDCTRLEFRFMAGTVKESIDDTVTYIFVGEVDSYSNVSKLSQKDIETIREYNIKIISNKWIRNCFRNQEMLSDTDYIIDNYIT